ncbi:MAG: hypothetical protein H6711_28510 [Myxococcales bacterium]|nr:hypothetical protein [Myxococcales bacterium]
MSSALQAAASAPSPDDESARALLERLTPAWRAALPSRLAGAAFDDFLRRNEPSILDLLRAHLDARASTPARAAAPSWFEVFNHCGGVPKEQSAAWRRAHAAAQVLFDNARHLVDLPPAELDLLPTLASLGSLPASFELLGDLDDPDEDDEAGTIGPTIRPDDLPSLVGTDAYGWTAEETGDLLAEALDAESRGGLSPDAHLVQRIAARIWSGPEGRLELVSVDKPTACAFIERHHAALPYCNPRGMMYAIGARLGGRLVAVATAGTPTGRWSDTGGCPVDGILELTRIASLGGLTRTDRRGRRVPVNASSALASRLLDLLPSSGRRRAVGCRFVTYSLAGERCTTYLSLVSKGLRPVARRRGKEPTGARGSHASLPHVDKIVWEDGPAARPPDWTLIAEERRVGAQRAFAAHLHARGE